MPDYYYNSRKYKNLKRRHKARRYILTFLLILLIIGAAVAFYKWQNSKSLTSQPIVVKPATKSYYSGSPKRVYQSDLFKFESATDWQLSREESIGTSKYVYFKQTNNIILYEFDILFDKSLNGKPVNYIMPLVVDNGKIKTEAMSDRCGDKIVAQSGNSAPNTMAMQLSGVSFICAVKGSTEKGAAGLVGGGYDITLKNSRAQPVVVNFSFVNNSSSYFAGTFKEVLESFTLR
ncbi:MAG TPA: hypothetical protein VLE51_01115 [Candidatus Saccharimonadales bacterium]|nr:hypothetical protein [Candidatus Saccharimonadales bacterium]